MLLVLLIVLGLSPMKIDTVEADSTIVDWGVRKITVNNCEEYPREACYTTLVGWSGGPDPNYCISHGTIIGKAYPIYNIEYTIDTAYRLTPEQVALIWPNGLPGRDSTAVNLRGDGLLIEGGADTLRYSDTVVTLYRNRVTVEYYDSEIIIPDTVSAIMDDTGLE
jgi:hypothetical protein